MIIKNSDKVNIGVIGLGVGRWHADSYIQEPNTNLVAVCDPDENRLKQAKEHYGVKAYSAYQEICNDDDVDAVSVCVPNYLHAPISIYALEHGKHVLCEKPLANNVGNGLAMVESAKASGLIAMVAMKFRYTNEAVYIHRLLENGELGEIYYGWTTYLRQLGGIPGMGGWFTRKPLSGGGPMIDNGVHFLDVLWWLMGCPNPTRVSGATYAKFGPLGKGAAGWDRIPTPEEFSVEDLATAIIHFENGASVLIDNCWAGFTPQETIGLRIMGTKGGATMWPFSVCKESNGKVLTTTPDLSTVNAKSQFFHFADCIINGKQPISSFENCFTVLKMLDAVYRSADAKAEVTV
ncbi:MAG: Gfo/Idh/MocA family protein [bacterium]